MISNHTLVGAKHLLFPSQSLLEWVSAKDGYIVVVDLVAISLFPKEIEP
jgi:hypothetical protein